MDVRDLEITNTTTARELVGQFATTGFQATEVARAAELIRRMHKEKAFVVLTFTANMVATGLRSLFARMAEKKMADMIITTGGAVEHDFMRSFEPYQLGSFHMNDVELHEKDINRIGNVLVPSERYVMLEKKLKPVFAKFSDTHVSPSAFIEEMGRHTEDKNSFLHWATKNRIPIISPGITDSAIGLQTYFVKQENPAFGIDVTADMKIAQDTVLAADKVGGIILGGGISKHHAIGVNILRGGMDYAVYVTTATPFDGSLSGAAPTEAKSWGKISEKANTVTVYSDATIAFPLIFSAII